MKNRQIVNPHHPKEKELHTDKFSLTASFFLVTLLPAVIIAAFYFLSYGGLFDLNEGSKTILETGLKTTLIIAGVIFFVTLLNGCSEVLPLTFIVITSVSAAWLILIPEASLLLLVVTLITLVSSLLTAHFLTDHGPYSDLKIYFFVLTATICGFLANVATGLALK